jgi:hypothetical protein
MDHVGVVARREAAKLVVSKNQNHRRQAARDTDGRLQRGPDPTKSIRFSPQSGILKDSYTATRLRFAENGTFNSFDPNMKTDSRIDHVFVSPSFHVDRYGILTNSYWTEKRRQ